MKSGIPKFERDMLHGENIMVRKRVKITDYRKHWHNYYEIIFYEDCKGYCILNGDRYEIEGKCLFLLTPKDFHEIVTVERPESYSINISFSEQMVDKRLVEVLTTGPVVLYFQENILVMLIEQLLNIYQGESLYRDIHMKHLFNDILIRILESGTRANGKNKDMHPIIRESITYILTNLSENMTLSEMSGRFGISETYFSQLFHQHTGVAFKQYQLSLRIEYAKRMLEDRELPIIDVGYECGFNTPSQFNRSFKRMVGMPPSQYRKEHMSGFKMSE